MQPTQQPSPTAVEQYRKVEAYWRSEAVAAHQEWSALRFEWANRTMPAGVGDRLSAAYTRMCNAQQAVTDTLNFRLDAERLEAQLRQAA